jgi:7-carboxy-7-deazaguanine synthase
MKLRITEIFLSLQGETRTVGIPTVFVRLTGCPLRCQYCDTAYAFQGGENLALEAIMQRVHDLSARFVTVTGGEPLAQKGCLRLLEALCEAGYDVSIETSGAMRIAEVDSRVVKVMDLKTPGSRESKRNDFSNLNYLLPRDQVKFVICNRSDYEWAKEVLLTHRLDQRCEVLFSPSYQELSPTLLADWILEDRLPVRFQIQLHKVLWGDVQGK